MTVLTTRARVERLVSAAAVDAFTDHAEVDDDVVDDCIEQASGEMLMFLHDRYEESALEATALVNHWCSVWTARLLFIRRGNPVPESLQAEYERVVAYLEKISAGTMNIAGLTLRGDSRPTWSNLRVDRRYPQSKVRVSRNNSSDAPTTLSQDTLQELPVYDG
jgi:phage gp36-like protein